MSLSVKFGNFQIFNQNIQNFGTNPNQNQWTKNKFYQPASNIEIKPTFLKNVETSSNFEKEFDEKKISFNKEIINKIREKFLKESQNKIDSKQDFSSIFLELKQNIYFDDIESMNRIKNENNNLIESFSKLSLNSEEKEKIKQSTTQNKEETLKLIEHNKYELLMHLDFLTLLKGDHESLIKYLKKQNSNKKGYVDINDMDLDFDLLQQQLMHNKVNNNNIDAFNKTPQKVQIEPVVDVFNIINRSNDDAFLSNLVECNEFRKLVNEPKLPDEKCRSVLASARSMEDACDLFFRQSYRESKLTLILVYPNGKRIEKAVPFTMTMDEMIVMNMNENWDRDHLPTFKVNNVLDIDTSKYKFIGAYKLANRSIINLV